MPLSLLKMMKHCLKVAENVIVWQCCRWIFEFLRFVCNSSNSEHSESEATAGWWALRHGGVSALQWWAAILESMNPSLKYVSHHAWKFCHTEKYKSYHTWKYESYYTWKCESYHTSAVLKDWVPRSQSLSAIGSPPLSLLAALLRVTCNLPSL